MTTKVVLVDPSSMAAYHFLNANEWSGVSKQIVSSCAAQYGLVNYSVTKLHDLFNNADTLCLPKLNRLKKQWAISKWSVERCMYLVEVPEVHLFIQVFLNSTKSFLDLIVQLISTENIVYKKVHGFHKKSKEPGGELMHTLKNKALDKEISSALYNLIAKHKKWIYEVIMARDSLVHPEKGLLQVMFQLELEQQGSQIELNKIIKPCVGALEFNQWADNISKELKVFSEDFMSTIQLHGRR